MSKFVLKNRPKKPAAPSYVTHAVGNDISLEYFLKSIDKFKDENPGMNPSHITVETEHDDYSGTTILLTSPATSFTSYKQRIREYRWDLKAYQTWQSKNKKQIETAKAQEKKDRAQRKMERTKERLTKELVLIDARLEKA